ncbi:hypothetical protein Mgra_00007877, partial [Meloidogyne graminicola]
KFAGTPIFTIWTRISKLKFFLTHRYLVSSLQESSQLSQMSSLYNLNGTIQMNTIVYNAMF